MTLRRAACLLAALLASGCEDAPEPQVRDVMTLEVPSTAEREAAQKFTEATSLAAAGHEKQAEPLLRRALELAPRHTSALALLADLLARRRDYAAAAPLYRQLVQMNPADELARKRLYESLYGLGDLEGADAACREWTTATPDSSDAWYALGTTLYALGRLDPSARALARASTLKAARADVRSQLGLVLLAQGKVSEAETAQRDAVSRDPRYGEAWFRLGEVVSRAGPVRYSEAIDAMRRALAADPSKLGYVHLYLYRLLRMAADAGDSLRAEDAANEWRTVLRVAGREVLRGHALGAPAAAVAEGEKEEKALRAAVIANPTDGQVRFRYALFLHRRGDVADAEREYAEAALTAPAFAPLRASHGAALLMLGDGKRAEPQLQEAVRLDPADVNSWRNLGWTLLVLERDDEAIAAFDRALAGSPDDLVSKKARGLARMHKGELDEGLQDVAAAGWIGR